ncbi:MAG TPA: DUF1684 domain-containing protein [Ktedonobacterales bacterium]
MSQSEDDRRYVRDIEEERRQKDAAFRAVPQSPIPAAERASFAGLAYYPLDPAFRVEATLAPFERPEVVMLGSTKGDVRPQLRFGELRFTLAGQECRLTGYKDAGDPDADELFVPFRDATTGHETYGAGRYLETEDPGGGLEPRPVTLDFNLAYSPWCAYNVAYSCTLPPAENVLPVAVTAGEKTYSAGH